MLQSASLTIRLFAFVALQCPLLLFGQGDTLNQTDESGRKQGYWILFKQVNGKKTALKLEEGRYVDGFKEGPWIKFYEDGKTPRIKGTYIHNRPKGDFERFHPNGQLSEKGNFYKNEFVGAYWQYYQNGHLKYYNPCGKENPCDSIYFYEEDGCLTHVDFRLNGSHNTIRSLVYSKTNCNQLLDTVINYDLWAESYMWENDTINHVQALRLTYPLQRDDVMEAFEYCKGNYLNEKSINFWQVVAAEKNALPILFDLLNETRLSGVSNKCGTRKLTIGELSYLAIVEIVEFPILCKSLNGQPLLTKCGGMDKFWRVESNQKELSQALKDYYLANASNLKFKPMSTDEVGAAYKKKYGVKGKYIIQP